MVIRSLFFLMAIAFSALVCAETTITTTIKNETATPGRPVEGSIIITCDKGAAIDDSSFLLGDTPLRVTFIARSDEQSTFTYHFFLPPQEKGTHILMPISVIIDGIRHHSPSLVYALPDISVSDTFRLESSAVGATALYPGRKAIFVYRIIMKEQIEISYTHLPLLTPEGFNAKALPRTRRYTSHNGEYIEEILQEVTATIPGTYSLGPSFIEGRMYRTDISGKKISLKPLMRAEAPPLSLTVLPFPEKGRPSSFSGAIGDCLISIKMLTPQEVSIGDKTIIEISITSDEDLSTVALPDIASLPTFHDSFRISETPTTNIIKGKSKIFTVELRPLSSSLKAIPPIEFSSFIPEKNCYVTTITHPIPLTVRPPLKPTLSHSEGAPDESKQISPPGAISENAFIIDKELGDKTIDIRLIITTILLGLILLGVQQLIRKKKKQLYSSADHIGSTELFKRAIVEKNGSLFIHTLEKAFILRLCERGYIAETVDSYTQLPKEGVAGSIRRFFQTLEKNRFSGAGERNKEDIISISKRIFFKEIP